MLCRIEEAIGKRSCARHVIRDRKVKDVVYLISIIVLVLTNIVVPFLIIRANNVKFSKDSLHSEEEIQTIAITHWFVTLKIIVLQLLITGLCVIMLIYETDELYNDNNLANLCLTVAAILLLLVRLKINVLDKCREFVVTNKRIIIKYGIVSRELKEYRYEKVESCDVKQNVLGRILQYGSIIILGVGGSGNKEHYVKNPFAFRQYIIDRIGIKNEAKDSIKNSPSGVNQIDAITELKEYKKLLEEGILTQEEFEKKKHEILNR